MSIKSLIALGCLSALTGAALAAGPIRLVENGKPAATIVIADEPIAVSVGRSLTVAYAAEELQRFIEKATGARLEIVPAAKAPASGTLVLVGRSALTEKHQLALPAKPEGLRIVAFPRGVAVLGQIRPAGAENSNRELDRGTLHGIYEFLERVVGYRFFIHIPKDPDLGIVTPAVKTLTVPADYNLELAPDFPFRAAGFATYTDPPAWRRVTREGSGNGFPGINHTDRWFGQKYFNDNPDWAAMISEDGARSGSYPCYSHPGVLAARVQTTQDIYDGKGGWFGEHAAPGPKWISFEPMDIWDFEWTGLCQCDRCKPQLRPDRGRYGKTSNLLFRHGAEFAAEIAKRWPNKRLGMLAYEGHMLPPDFPLPENLDVQVCLMWSNTMNKEPYWHERNLQLIRDWSKKLGGKRERLYIWSFYCYPAYTTSAPLFFPHNLQKWIQDIYPFSSGEFICPGANPPQYEIVMAWLWHRLLWDRNADVDALLRDQCMTLFGPAGKTMEKLYATVADRYENVKWSKKFDVETYIPPDQAYGETFTAESVAALKKLFQEALAAAGADETNIYRRRVAWMQQGFGPFFRSADLAHKWLGKTLSYKVAAVAKAPADAAAWAAVPALTLVQGNFGKDPDAATRVRLARAGGDLLVRFEADLPSEPVLADRLALCMPAGQQELALAAKAVRPSWIPVGQWNRDPERFAAVNGEGEVSGPLQATLVSNTYTDGVWTVVLKAPVAALGVKPGDAKPVEVQLERKLAGRPKAPAGDYYWVPPMKPVWFQHIRFGRLEFDGK